MLFLNQGFEGGFEPVDFVLPMDKKSWYSPREKNWLKAKPEVLPLSEENEEVIEKHFGKSEGLTYLDPQGRDQRAIAQLKKSKNNNWTFLLHDGQEIQFVFSEAGNLAGARFRHNHIGEEAAKLYLDALEKHGYNIYAESFVENGLKIKGSKEFVKNAQETLKAHIAERRKFINQNTIAPAKEAQTMVPTPFDEAIKFIRQGTIAAADKFQPTEPTPSAPPSAPLASSLQTSLSAVVPQEFLRANPGYSPEVQADLLEVVTDWAWYLREELSRDLGAGKLKQGSPEHTKRVAESDLVNKIETMLSGAKDEVTGTYPSLPESTLSAIKRDIGPKGEDPLVIGAKQPDFTYIAQKLGIQIAQPAQRPVTPSAQQGAYAPQQPSQQRGPSLSA